MTFFDIVMFLLILAVAQLILYRRIYHRIARVISNNNNTVKIAFREVEKKHVHIVEQFVRMAAVYNQHGHSVEVDYDVLKGETGEPTMKIMVTIDGRQQEIRDDEEVEKWWLN